MNAKFADAVLRRLGHEVDFAHNGKVGVEKFLKNEYDLILMDIQMPVMNGLEAAAKIREYEAQMGVKNRIPIIAVTAFAMEHDRSNCIAAGMDEYMTKPYRPADLEKMIDKVMNK